MGEKELNEIRNKSDFDELDNLPETLEDIQEEPILKPLIEFHKQASMLIKEDKLEHEFLLKIKDEIYEDLKTGIYDSSNIVRKYIMMQREYDRLILVYSRYTDLADEKILELKKIVEKYYITKIKFDEAIEEITSKLNELEKDNKGLRKEIKSLIEEKETHREKTYEDNFLENEKEKPEPNYGPEENYGLDNKEERERITGYTESVKKKNIKQLKKKQEEDEEDEEEEEEEEFEEYLKRKKGGKK